MVPVVAISQLKCQLTSEFGQGLTVFWSNNRNYFSIFKTFLNQFHSIFFFHVFAVKWMVGGSRGV